MIENDDVKEILSKISFKGKLVQGGSEITKNVYSLKTKETGKSTLATFYVREGFVTVRVGPKRKVEKIKNVEHIVKRINAYYEDSIAERKQISIYGKVSLFEDLEKKARELDSTVNNIIIELLNEFVYGNKSFIPREDSIETYNLILGNDIIRIQGNNLKIKKEINKLLEE